MVPRLNQVLAAARKASVAVIHSPSSTMDFYEDAPQRRRMIEAPHVMPPVPISRWCYLDKHAEAPLPIDDTKEPCDDEVGRPRVRMYKRQHPDIVIGPYDGISDRGQEIYNYCELLGIRNVVMTGVHTNMCVLGRPFGIRQMKLLGRNVVLVRDLTDAMYDPRDEPYVSHQRGTDMVIEHVEQFWCPSILSGTCCAAAWTSRLRCPQASSNPPARRPSETAEPSRDRQYLPSEILAKHGRKSQRPGQRRGCKSAHSFEDPPLFGSDTETLLVPARPG